MGDLKAIQSQVRNLQHPVRPRTRVATVLEGSVQRAGDRVRVTTMCAADEVKVGWGKKRKWLLFNPNQLQKLAQ